jgi:hypothetical protein
MGCLLGLDTPRKAAIFFGYICLWCWIRAFVFYSTHAPSFPSYDRSAVVTTAGVCKLLLSVGLFLQADGSPPDLVRQWRRNCWLWGKYAVLAALYAAYDNLTFVALSLLSPYVYQVVMQLRLVATALLWQLLFSRRLSAPQWLSIATISVAVAAFNLEEVARAAGHSDGAASSDEHAGDGGGTPVAVGAAGAVAAAAAARTADLADATSSTAALAHRSLGVTVALLQILCAVAAGVACEYLLKNRRTAQVPLNLQNCFMYVVT